MKNIESINVRLALFYLMSIATIGVMLRWYSIEFLPIDYKGFLHAHSHTAFLGWVYVSFVVILNKLYIPVAKLKSKSYLWISILTHITLLGILVSFPIQSYGFFSILFLSLFLISTYFYVWFFRKNKVVTVKHTLSFSFVRMALFFMLFSGIAPWLLGAVIKLFGKTSVIYHDSIYFYLHFQYNGWFLFALLGVVLFFIEEKDIVLPTKKLKFILRLLLISTFLSYFSNVLWSSPSLIFNGIAFVGVVGEWISLFLLLKYFYTVRESFKNEFSSYQTFILVMVFALLMVKASLQLFQVFPYFAIISYQIRNFIIAYLHLILLGIFTPFLFLFLHQNRLIVFSKLWFSVFYIGFVLNEVFLFTHAITIWGEWKTNIPFSWLLLVVSILMLVGISALFVKNLNIAKNQDINSQ